MIIRSQPNRLDRRALVGSSLAWFLLGLPAGAAAAVLTPDKLKSLVARTLAETDTTPLSRPHILGFTEDKLVTRSIESGDHVHKHGFMVVIPHHADGIVMFEGKDDKPLFFAIHRTGEHLNRVASAINRDGQLSNWSGAEAEKHFAEQKSFWAGQ
jgi:hypothetical protein